MGRSSSCMGDTSIQMTQWESMKQLSTTLLNSFNQGKTWQHQCIEIQHMDKLWTLLVLTCRPIILKPEKLDTATCRGQMKKAKKHLPPKGTSFHPDFLQCVQAGHRSCLDQWCDQWTPPPLLLAPRLWFENLSVQPSWGMVDLQVMIWICLFCHCTEDN